MSRPSSTQTPYDCTYQITQTTTKSQTEHKSKSKSISKLQRYFDMSQVDTQHAPDNQRARASSPAAASIANLVSPGRQNSSKKQRTHQDGVPDLNVTMERLQFDESRIAEHTRLQSKGFFHYVGDYHVKPINLTDLTRPADKKKGRSIPREWSTIQRILISNLKKSKKNRKTV